MVLALLCTCIRSSSSCVIASLVVRVLSFLPGCSVSFLMSCHLFVILSSVFCLVRLFVCGCPFVRSFVRSFVFLFFIVSELSFMVSYSYVQFFSMTCSFLLCLGYLLFLRSSLFRPPLLDSFAYIIDYFHNFPIFPFLKTHFVFPFQFRIVHETSSLPLLACPCIVHLILFIIYCLCLSSFFVFYLWSSLMFPLSCFLSSLFPLPSFLFFLFSFSLFLSVYSGSSFFFRRCWPFCSQAFCGEAAPKVWLVGPVSRLDPGCPISPTRCRRMGG